MTIIRYRRPEEGAPRTAARPSKATLPLCAAIALSLWAAPGRAEAPWTQLDDGIAYRVETSAPNAAQPEEGDTVIVAYTAIATDGSIVGEANAEAPGTFTIPLPARGWMAAITNMHIGDQWLIRVPAASASGVPTRATGPRDLVVRTRLIDLRKHRPGPDDLIG